MRNRRLGDRSVGLRAFLWLLAVSFAVLAACGEDTQVSQPRAVIGADDALLTPQFWIERLEGAERVTMERAAIEEQNGRLFALDSSMHDLRAFARTLRGEQVAALLTGLGNRPPSGLYDETGQLVADESLQAIFENRNVDSIPSRQATRYGLVVTRADLRTFPTALRVFRSPSDSDIDRFQETALFPGTPVIIAHESRDGDWWFVISPRYAAWVRKALVAEGAAGEVFGYVDKAPYRVVTGAKVHTVFNPEQPALSELQLDMGVRVPLFNADDAVETVDGQHPYSAHVIELPVRGDTGTLRIEPALLQKNTDTAGDYLPLSRANVIRQGFKFLGERYGWGHSYNGRDCSGFVSEVYRSMGAIVPRNTSAQSVSPALQKQQFDRTDSAEARMAAVSALDVGDLVYIPGHVMMVIGSIDGEPWVIHDTTGASYRTAEGDLQRVTLNAVSVTPLLPLQFNETERYVDRMTSVVKIVPDPDKEASSHL